MRTFRFLNLAILSVLVGSAALMYAQDEKPQEDKPAKQEDAKPQPKQDEAKPARPDEAKPRQEEAKPSNQDKQEGKQDEKRGQEQSHQQAMPDRQDHPAMQDNRAPQGQEHPEQRAGNGQPAGKGGRIPDDKFRAQFGREHHFNARSVIVQGRPQFQYGGYSFQLVDAWPADWAYTDDCYIDYIDGQYFLIDLMHPGIRLAVFVVM